MPEPVRLLSVSTDMLLHRTCLQQAEERELSSSSSVEAGVAWHARLMAVSVAAAATSAITVHCIRNTDFCLPTGIKLPAGQRACVTCLCTRDRWMDKTLMGVGMGIVWFNVPLDTILGHFRGGEK